MQEIGRELVDRFLRTDSVHKEGEASVGFQGIHEVRVGAPQLDIGVERKKVASKLQLLTNEGLLMHLVEDIPVGPSLTAVDKDKFNVATLKREQACEHDYVEEVAVGRWRNSIVVRDSNNSGRVRPKSAFQPPHFSTDNSSQVSMVIP